MNKDDIKKALECCRNGCPICDCPYYGIKDCENNLFKDTIDLITEQEKEIEQLKFNISQAQDQILATAQKKQEYREQQIKQAKIDVLVELRNKCHNYYPSIDHYCCSVKAVKLSDINKMIEELKQ